MFFLYLYEKIKQYTIVSYFFYYTRFWVDCQDPQGQLYPHFFKFRTKKSRRNVEIRRDMRLSGTKPFPFRSFKIPFLILGCGTAQSDVITERGHQNILVRQKDKLCARGYVCFLHHKLLSIPQHHPYVSSTHPFYHNFSRLYSTNLIFLSFISKKQERSQ